MQEPSETKKHLRHVLICSLREDLVDGVTQRRKTLLPFVGLWIQTWNTCWERPLKGAACCHIDDIFSVPMSGHLWSSGLPLSLHVVVKRVPLPEDWPPIFSVMGCAINQP